MEKFLFYKAPFNLEKQTIQIGGVETEAWCQTNDWQIDPRMLDLMQEAGLMNTQWDGAVIWDTLSEQAQRSVFNLVGLVMRNIKDFEEFL